MKLTEEQRKKCHSLVAIMLDEILDRECLPIFIAYCDENNTSGIALATTVEMDFAKKLIVEMYESISTGSVTIHDVIREIAK